MGWTNSHLHQFVIEGRFYGDLERYPFCLDGARNCPPEDMGSVWEYFDYLHAVGDPTHEEHKSHLEWSGPFDPEQFDTGAATRRLRRGLELEADL